MMLKIAEKLDFQSGTTAEAYKNRKPTNLFKGSNLGFGQTLATKFVKKLQKCTIRRIFCYYYGTGMLGCVARHLIWEISDKTRFDFLFVMFFEEAFLQASKAFFLE